MFRSAPINDYKVYRRPKRFSYNMKSEKEDEFPQEMNYKKIGESEATLGDEEFDKQYRWRFEARAVAYLGLVLGYCFVTACIFATAALIFVTVQMKRGYLDQSIQDMIPGLEPETENLYFSIGFTIVLIAGVISGCEIWAANSLQHATTKVLKPHESLKKCVKWRNINLCLLVLSFGTLITATGYNVIGFVILIKIRVVSVLLVWLHIRELNRESQKTILVKEKYAVAANDILYENIS